MLEQAIATARQEAFDAVKYRGVPYRIDIMYREYYVRAVAISLADGEVLYRSFEQYAG